MGSTLIYRSSFLDPSVGHRQNPYNECCISLAEPWMCVQYGKCARMHLIVCAWREVGCSFVEATCIPSVQEVKQGESEITVHPQMTRKTRAGPCPERERESNIHVFVYMCVYV